jgi:hypothetical protein
MSDVTYTAAKIRPLDGAIVRPFYAGAAFDLGLTVKIQQNGTVIKSNNDSAIGIPVSTQQKASAAVTGDRVGVVIFGPVEGFTGGVPGMIGFVSATAGRIATTGTKAIGYWESSTCFFVMPDVSSAASS